LNIASHSWLDSGALNLGFRRADFNPDATSAPAGAPLRAKSAVEPVERSRSRRFIPLERGFGAFGLGFARFGASETGRPAAQEFIRVGPEIVAGAKSVVGEHAFEIKPAQAQQ
jgi:hypothetical protein